MPADQGPELLNAHFGTQSPHWRLAFDSNATELSAVKGKAHVAVALSAMEAAKIRRLTGVTASLELTITLAGEPLHLHLVGRRVNNLEWAGTASAFSDTLSVARDLVHGLSFAEQVVSEANSVIVIVDQHGRIQRFNRLSEEYTGLREHEVIGKNVFQLFMSPEEAAASRRNIAGFFRNGSSYEVERWVKRSRANGCSCSAISSCTAAAARTRCILSAPVPTSPKNAVRRSGCGCWPTPISSPAYRTVTRSRTRSITPSPRAAKRVSARSTSISTTSRRSTTPTAICSAIGCWSRSRWRSSAA